MNSESKAFDVFISYSTRNEGEASSIRRHLENRGLLCWRAAEDMEAGEKWPAAIKRAITTCKVMVLVWTGHSMQSPEVSKELNLAMKLRVAIVPFRLEDVAPTEEWDYHLADTHWLDATRGKIDDHLETLARRVSRILSKPLRPVRAEVPPQQVRLSCPRCGQSIEAPSSLVGTVICCPICAQRLHVGARKTAASSEHAGSYAKLKRCLPDLNEILFGPIGDISRPMGRLLQEAGLSEPAWLRQVCGALSWLGSTASKAATLGGKAFRRCGWNGK